jgi:hypothetical protein
MTDNQRSMTNQPAAEELKYNCNRARRRQCPTTNMFEAWQNLATFGGKPIGGAVEALLTKVVNRQYDNHQMLFFCSRCC